MRRALPVFVFLVLFPSLGPAAPAPSGPDRFALMDADSDGFLSRQEFGAALPKLSAAAFDGLDGDKDGRISRKEREAFAKGHGMRMGGFVGAGGGALPPLAPPRTPAALPPTPPAGPALPKPLPLPLLTPPAASAQSSATNLANPAASAPAWDVSALPLLSPPAAQKTPSASGQRLSRSLPLLEPPRP